jgi:predicted TIM-barrel fold metal-dependent hydrolase
MRASAVDCHFHVFAAHAGVLGARYVPSYEATFETWRSVAQAVGVMRGVLVQPSFLGTDNALLVRTIAAHPHTLRGVAVVDPYATAESLQAMRATGVRGVRFNLAGVAHDYSTLRNIPAAHWDALLACDLHVELHTDPGRVSTLLPLIPERLTVVLDHFGRTKNADGATPTIADAAVRAQHSPVYVKLSAPYRLDNLALADALAKRWLDALGPDALLWGSDWPHTNMEAFADFAALRWRLDTWIPDAHTRLNVLAHNPARLYWRE